MSTIIKTNTKKTPVLIVIDMQGAYRRDIDKYDLHKYVPILIEHFKRNDCWILNVTMDGHLHHNDVIPEVKNVLDINAKKILQIVKANCDGSKEVFDIIREYDFDPQKNQFFICGVYAHDCVLKTSKGLANNYNIRPTLIAKGTDFPNTEDWGINLKIEYAEFGSSVYEDSILKLGMELFGGEINV